MRCQNEFAAKPHGAGQLGVGAMGLVTCVSCWSFWSGDTQTGLYHLTSALPESDLVGRLVFQLAMEGCPQRMLSAPPPPGLNEVLGSRASGAMDENRQRRWRHWRDEDKKAQGLGRIKCAYFIY